MVITGISENALICMKVIIKVDFIDLFGFFYIKILL